MCFLRGVIIMTTAEVYLQTRSTFDSCKGIRSCFRSLTNTIAASRVATSIVVFIPILIMIFTLILREFYEYSMYSILSPPIFVVSSLTFVFGIIGLISIKTEMQNLLGFAAFVYAGIGYWALINILILFSAGWSYWPADVMVKLLTWFCFPTCMWLFASSVMDRHRILVSDAIANRVGTPKAPVVEEMLNV